MDRTTKTPVVILEEVGGGRLLPIWIGPAEARAIATEMADPDFPRPLTHALCYSVLKQFGGVVERVVITSVEKSTYYAELIVHADGDVLSFDARPSDSIAIALRAGARIFADDELLEDATIEFAEDEPTILAHEAEDETSSSLDAKELKELLRGMNPEDFGRFTP
ncbi:MAG: bifunctional nuclease family protein [Gemmatimonadota bacterium]